MLITLIGCGKMGSAMLQGWLNDTDLDAEFVIIEPFQDALGWTDAHDNVILVSDCAAAKAIGKVSQMVILAVKPQMMEEAIADLSGIADSGTAFLSIAAGIPTSWFAKRLGADALILRSMPNTPLPILGGNCGTHCSTFALRCTQSGYSLSRFALFATMAVST